MKENNKTVDSEMLITVDDLISSLFENVDDYKTCEEIDSLLPQNRKPNPARTHVAPKARATKQSLIET